MHTFEKAIKELENLKYEKNTFEILFDASPNGIALIENSVFVQCNQQMIDLFECQDKRDFFNKNPQDIFQIWDDILVSFEAKEGDKSTYHQFEWEFQKSENEVLWLEITASLLEINQKEMIYLICKDVTERKNMELALSKQQAILLHQAHYDPLTNLPNKTMFLEELNRRIKDKKILALLYMDLDRFKDINDSLGHDMGDKVLEEVAQRLKVQLNGGDFIARLGGDEFVVILESVESKEEIIYMATKIQNSVKKPLSIEGMTLYTTASIGISLCPQDDTSAKNLLKFADTAMYQAKEQGNGYCRFYTQEMTQVAYKQAMVERDLRNGIEKNEFIVYYQPQVDVVSEKIIGMEALVRWNHPTLGLLSPSKFVPIAIKTGLIVDIDLLVMHKAMSDVNSWIHAGLKPGVLSLNLTMKQLEQPHVVQTIKDLLTRYELRAESLSLEITEDEMMKKPDYIIALLKELSYMGISIAIDDFGTGYSSLSYLKRMPIDKLKIDKSFINDIPYDEEAIAIVEMIIALTNTLQIDIIAEGVETEEQKNFMVEKGCHEIQGYYYSKPLIEKDMRNMLEKEVLNLEY
jgi:diguanylate cyclase (GGDEF)-like protein